MQCTPTDFICAHLKCVSGHLIFQQLRTTRQILHYRVGNHLLFPCQLTNPFRFLIWRQLCSNHTYSDGKKNRFEKENNKNMFFEKCVSTGIVCDYYRWMQYEICVTTTADTKAVWLFYLMCECRPIQPRKGKIHDSYASPRNGRVERIHSITATTTFSEQALETFYDADYAYLGDNTGFLFKKFYS